MQRLFQPLAALCPASLRIVIMPNHPEVFFTRWRIKVGGDLVKVGFSSPLGARR